MRAGLLCLVWWPSTLLLSVASLYLLVVAKVRLVFNFTLRNRWLLRVAPVWAGATHPVIVLTLGGVKQVLIPARVIGGLVA